MKFRCQLFFISALIFSGAVAAAEKIEAPKPWPFDQREVLLVKDASKSFPDELTVAQIMDIFAQRGRVRWVTRTAPKGYVFPVETPVDFAWHSSPAVRNLGLRHKVDGIVMLSQTDSQIDLKWYAVSDGLPIFFETVKLPAVTSDSSWKEIRKKRLTEWLTEIWNRIPGFGYVVQRDGGQLLLEGVSNSGAEMGDKMDLIRIKSLERHPVLKTIVKVEVSDTGYAKLLSVSKDLSKAEIVYEAEIDPIIAGDRYIVSKESVAGTTQNETHGVKKEEAKKVNSLAPGQRISFFENKKKMIDLTAAFTLSSFKHSEVHTGTTYEMSSGQLSPGVDLQGLLYFTHTWIMGGDIALAFFNYKNVPGNYGVGSINSGLSSFNIYGGYRFLFLEKLAAPADLRLLVGYRSWSMSMQQTTSDFAPSAKRISGLELGLSVGFPVYKAVSAQFRGGRTVGTTLSEKPLTSGDAPAPTFWNFGGRLEYALDKNSQVFAGFSFESSTTNYDGQGQRTRPATSLNISRRSMSAGYTHAF